MRRIALGLFVVTVVGVIIAIVIDNLTLYRFLKPMIMATLGMYYISSSPASGISKVVIGAIVFSLIGDVLLMFPSLFIQGLVAFLFAQVCYIFAYRQHRSIDRADPLKGVHRIRLAFPIILAASGLVIVLFPVLGDLKIPVIIYATVLCLMVLQALFRHNKTDTQSFWMVFSGAVLFMISDSMIAINKFLEAFAGANLLIMITYMLGQFLIIAGLIRHRE